MGGVAGRGGGGLQGFWGPEAEQDLCRHRRDQLTFERKTGKGQPCGGGWMRGRV